MGNARLGVVLMRCNILLLSIVLPLLPAGCSGNWWSVVKKSPNVPAAAESESFIQTMGGLFGESIPEGKMRSKLEEAKVLFSQKKYAEARSIFYSVSASKHAPPAVAEEALYYEAECQRMQAYYPSAAEIYTKLVKNYPRGRFHKEALRRMFDIANYWLDETREVMKARAEQKAGKRKIVWPVSLVHFEKSKPFLDMEGRAVVLLEQVYLNDIDGPLGEQALFFLGNINFYHEAYTEADHYYSQIIQWHPNGKYAPQALELSIMCKQLGTGGPEYDGRKTAEARELVHRAMNAYPEIAHQKSEFLQRQLATINMQQAEKDLGIADFYRRTKHPGSAYFYYEIVRRRYPGTKQAKIATERMNEIRHLVEQEELHGQKKSFLDYIDPVEQIQKARDAVAAINPFAKEQQPATIAPSTESSDESGVPAFQSNGGGPPRGFILPPTNDNRGQQFNGFLGPEMAPAPRPYTPSSIAPGYSPNQGIGPNY